MKSWIKIFLITLFVLTIKLAYPQSNQISNKILSYIRLNQNYPVEKLYVQTNKTLYIIGEEIRFSTYIVDNKTLSPSKLSKVGFIELINNQNKTVLQKIVKVGSGYGTGTLSIPDTLSSGGYMLRCYTSWMKNFGYQTFYQQEIILINPNQNNQHLFTYCTDSILSGDVNVFFYPEGGNLMQNTVNQVGIRVKDQYHRGIQIEGVLTDDNKGTVCKVITNKDGIGSFSYKPLKDSLHYLSFAFNDSNYLAQLPRIDLNAVNIHVFNDDSASIRIIARANNTHLEQRDSLGYLFIHSRGNVNYLNKVKLSDSSAVTKVNEDSLSVGLNHIVLFDLKGNVLSQRCYFKQPEYGSVAIKRTDKKIKTRDSVTVELEHEFLKESSLVSLTAFVDTYIADRLNSSYSLMNYLLFNSLTNERNINLSNYLSKGENNKLYKLEDLLLVTKYDSPSWNIVFEDQLFKPKFRPDVHGLTFRGEVIDSRSGQPLKELDLILNFPGQHDKIWFTHTNSEGEFRFHLANVQNTIDFVIQPLDYQYESIIKVDYLFMEENHSMHTIPCTLTNEMISYANTASIYQQIENIYYPKDKVRKTNNMSLNAFYGSPDHSVGLEKYIDLPNMQYIFLEVIPGIKIKKRKGEMRFRMYSPETGRIIRGEPTIFVDGVYIKNHKKIVEMNPQTVKNISSVNASYLYGGRKMNGIISIYTKKGDCTDVSLPKAAIRRMYSTVNDSYSTMNNKRIANNQHLPIFKTDLYWNKLIYPDNKYNNNLQFEFLTSDAKLTYRITIQGISEKGIILEGTEIIRVE